jgi:hypothetical protein
MTRGVISGRVWGAKIRWSDWELLFKLVRIMLMYVLGIIVRPE